MVQGKQQVVERSSAVPSGKFTFRMFYGAGIEVDPDGGAFARLSRDAHDKLDASGAERAPLGALLRAVCNTVDAAMSNACEGTPALVLWLEDKQWRAMRDGKGIVFKAEDFIEAGAGFCRHKAPVAAALMKTFTDELGMDGKVLIHVNYAYSAKEGLRGHSWASYCAEGQEYVIDPTLNFVGSASRAGEGYFLNRETGAWNGAKPPWDYDSLLKWIGTSAILCTTSSLSWVYYAAPRFKKLIRQWV